MKDWSKIGVLTINHGSSYVYDSELESIDKFSGKKLILFKTSLPGHDYKSLVMIASDKEEICIELGENELRALFLKFCEELEEN